MKNKIIFLDIDGVLNSFDNMYCLNFNRKLSGSKSRDEYGILFDERCVKWLSYIIETTKCKIVISSSWKYKGLQLIQEIWKFRNLPGEVIDITPSIIDEEIFTPNGDFHINRGYEIAQWIENNKFTGKYCIIDDNTDMLKSQPFVQINKEFGLTRKNVKEIIKLLIL